MLSRKRMSRVRWAAAGAMLLCAIMASGQGKKNELGLLLGGIITPEQSAAGGTPISIDKGLSLQATYARCSTGHFCFELPFNATPSTEVRSNASVVPANYASIFVTPGLRYRVAPNASVDPWLAVGAGYGRFDESETRNDGAPNSGARGKNTAALQVGAGVDVNTGLRLLLPLGFRGEVRDYYSGTPHYNVAGPDRQHNVVVSGGIVLRF